MIRARNFIATLAMGICCAAGAANAQPYCPDENTRLVAQAQTLRFSVDENAATVAGVPVRIYQGRQTLDISYGTGAGDLIVPVADAGQAWVAQVQTEVAGNTARVTAVQGLGYADGTAPPPGERRRIQKVLQSISFYLSDQEAEDLEAYGTLVKGLTELSEGAVHGQIAFTSSEIAEGDLLLGIYETLLRRHRTYSAAKSRYQTLVNLGVGGEIAVSNPVSQRLDFALSQMDEVMSAENTTRRHFAQAALLQDIRELDTLQPAEPTVEPEPVPVAAYIPRALRDLDIAPRAADVAAMITDDRILRDDIQYVPEGGGAPRDLVLLSSSDYVTLQNAITEFERLTSNAYRDLMIANNAWNNPAIRRDVRLAGQYLPVLRAYRCDAGPGSCNVGTSHAEALVASIRHHIAIIEHDHRDLLRAADGLSSALETLAIELDDQAPNLATAARTLARHIEERARINSTAVDTMARERQFRYRRNDLMEDAYIVALVRAEQTDPLWMEPSAWRAGIEEARHLVADVRDVQEKVQQGTEQRVADIARAAQAVEAARASLVTARRVAAVELCAARNRVINGAEAASATETRDITARYLDHSAEVMGAVGSVRTGLGHADRLRSTRIGNDERVQAALDRIDETNGWLERLEDIYSKVEDAGAVIAYIDRLSGYLDEAEQNPGRAAEHLDEVLSVLPEIADRVPGVAAAIAPLLDAYMQVLSTAAEFADRQSLVLAWASVEAQNIRRVPPPDRAAVRDALVHGGGDHTEQTVLEITLYYQANALNRLIRLGL